MEHRLEVAKTLDARTAELKQRLSASVNAPLIIAREVLAIVDNMEAKLGKVHGGFTPRNDEPVLWTVEEALAEITRTGDYRKQPHRGEPVPWDVEKVAERRAKRLASKTEAAVEAAEN